MRIAQLDLHQAVQEWDPMLLFPLTTFFDLYCLIQRNAILGFLSSRHPKVNASNVKDTSRVSDALQKK